MILKALGKTPPNTLNDQQILEGLRQEQQFGRCVRQIYQKCYEMVESFILENSGTPQDAEDIFQEAILVFVQLAENDRLSGTASIRTVMYSISRNMWLDTLRKNSRYMVKEKFSAHEVPLQEDSSEQMARQEKQEAIMEVFEQLGEPCKSLLLAYYYEGANFTELLHRFEGRFKNEQVIRNRKSKCLKSLKKQLEEKPEASREFKENLTLNQP